MRRSAPITWDQVRVGVFLLVALFLLALGIFFIGRTGHVFGERYRVVTLLGTAAGLAPGATVQVAGQNAGQVDRIELIDPARRPPGGESVAVWLAVNREVREQVRADSRVRVRTQGLLGDRLIDIEPGSAEAPILTEGDTVPAAPAVSFNELFDHASEAVVHLTDLTRGLSDATERVLAGEGTLGRLMEDDALYDRLVALADGLDRLLAVATEGEGPLARMLRDDALYDRLSGTAASLDTLTGRIARGEGSLGRLVASDSLYRALTGVASRTDSLLESVQAGRGSLGRLVTEEALYEELLRALVDLNAMLEELRREPRRYIPPIEVF